MSAEAQSGYAAFQPRARLLKLIGAELISDEVVAITELVKNAHDADARSVVIRFTNATSAEGEIVVEDDGEGMDRDSLLGGWMSPAGSTKREASRRVTASGRRVLGEKGLGRFAADKLGRHLELVSHRSGAAAEVCAVFDWDEFDSDTRMLEEIHSRWEIRPAASPEHHGTRLRISGLRTTWTERMFRRLCTRLSRLRSPFRDKDNFVIRIESDVFPEYSGEIVSDFLERTPYSIDARFDGEDTIKVKLGKAPPRDELWTGPGRLSCGSVRVRLYAFDLETEALARLGPRAEVRAWLREWSGVSVYRDGFRVWPYGEPHDDWLRLDQRRVNNPVLRLSNNQVVGFVEISQDTNPELKDQTNREGMVNNQALEDLRRLLYFVFQLLESERQGIRHHTEQRKPTPGAATADTNSPIAQKLEAIASGADRQLATELRRLASEARTGATDRTVERRQLAEGLAEIAALGHVSAGMIQDLRILANRIMAAKSQLRSVAGGVSDLSPALITLEESAEQLLARVELLASINGDVGRRRRAIDVHAELVRFRESIHLRLAQASVTLRVLRPRSEVIRVDMNPRAFHAVLHIVIASCLEWLRNVRAPEIALQAQHEDASGSCVIDVGDTGGSNAQAMAMSLFAASNATHPGMMAAFAARTLVQQHGGTIEALTDRRRRGATIRIVLPCKRSRATLG